MMMEDDDDLDYEMEDKRMYLSQAFPGRDWKDAEIDAFSDFVKACVKASSSGGEKKEAKGSDLMLVFGDGPKGKK